MQSNAFLQIGGKAEYRSNALNNLFLDRMYLGGFIDDNLKNQVSEELVNQNRFGGTVNGNLSYWSFSDSLLKNQDIGMMLQIEQRVDAHLSFTDDFFELTYRGTQPFLGETADLSRLYSGFYTYQKFGFGLFDKRSLSFVRLSLVNGQTFFETDISDATLHVDGNSDSLMVNYLGSINFSDSTNSGLNKNNGLGAALDLRANIPLKNDAGFIQINFKNLGFIAWNENSHNYSADTSMIYKGFDLEEIFNDGVNDFEIPTLSDTLAFTRKRGKMSTFHQVLLR